ncbi:MAG: hypothetical protein LAT76_02035 [Schleiferiaceae bacterium]|nr:hypothetical protein [Schleiferiaceae bacterium]
MKYKQIFSPLLFLAFGVLIATGCVDDNNRNIYSQYEPIYILRSDMDKAVKFVGEKQMNKTGKIYIYKDFLFVNEQNEGIHIVDNANPKDPKRLGFIAIPGNRDLSIRDGILYADNVTDLLSIQLPIENKPFKVLHRQMDLFPEITPPDGMPFRESVLRARPENAIIMDFRKLKR